MPSNYRGPKKNDGKIVDKFRDACPPHKVKDLDALVKQCKGDEAKIQAKITEWWDEPVIEEPQWEAVGKVNKKVPEKSSSRGSGGGDRVSGSRSSDKGGASGSGRTERRGDRSSHGGGGRDGPRRDGRGGRAGGSGRYGDRDRDRNRGGDRGQKSSASASASNSVPKKKKESGVPTPVTNVAAPKGAWGSGGQSFAAAAASSSEPKSAPAQAPEPQAPPAISEPEATPVLEPENEVPVDLGGPSVNMLALEDPTPSGLTSPAAALSPPPVATGNVWGTKGGAHLIQAAKKPVPAPTPEVVVEPELEPEAVPEEPEPEPLPVVDEPETELEQTLVKESSFNVSLDNVLPPSVNGANINASGWEPVLDTTDSTSQQQLEPSPVGPISADPIMPEPEPEPISLPKPSAVAVAPAAPGPAGGVKPSSVLNMGHWETGEDDDLDFGFGSFGAPENDTEVTTTTTNSSNGASQPPSAGPGASPARPPPGLSMPPMPANAMLVHELEGKLDNTTLGPKVDTNNTEKTTTQSSQPQFDAVNQLTSQMGNPPGMSQYGGMGMYNIPPVPGPNALGSMPPSQFPLGGAANNQQQSSDSRPGNPPSQLNQATGQQQQQGYGMQPNTTSASTNTSAPGTDNAPNTTAGAPGSGNAPGMPPGMPSSMQYPNPAYMYAAQPGQFNQMGHPAYGMQAAAYGYGQQFAPQGGHQFGGYNQPGLMGQGGGGYGAPSHYDDQRGGRGGNSGNNMRDNHQGGGYNKGGGRGYRGNRNNHHNNNHGSGYGNNYGQSNPNVGGYGASPYGNMGGYGGYGNPGGPSGMDHYGMQQQQQQQQQGGGGYGGFSHQDDKKQGGGFQQQSHLHQQPLGLHGTSTDTGTAGGASAGGWPGSRQNWGGNWQQEN